MKVTSGLVALLVSGFLSAALCSTDSTEFTETETESESVHDHDHNHHEDKTPPANFQELRTWLLEKYDSKVPPSFAVTRFEPGVVGENKNEPGPTQPEATIVRVHMDLLHLSLDEHESVFYANAKLHMAWEDSRLAWPPNTEIFPTDVLYGDAEIWKPEIVVQNSAQPEQMEIRGSPSVPVSPDGTVNWVASTSLMSICTLDMRGWPHDSHTCLIKMGSAESNHGLGVDFQLKFLDSSSGVDETENINFENWIPSSQWKLLRYNATRNAITHACCQQPFVDITFSFEIQRNSPLYVLCFTFPICVIALLNTVLFLLPPSSGQKINLASINFGVTSIFLIYFESRLPSYGDHVPLIVLLYALNLVLAAISVVISVVVLNLATTQRSSPPARCLGRLVSSSKLLRILGLGHLTRNVSQKHSRLLDGMEMRSQWGNDHLTPEPEPEPGESAAGKNDLSSSSLKEFRITNEDPHSNPEWKVLAAIIDRISFIVYALVSGLMLGIFLA